MIREQRGTAALGSQVAPWWEWRDVVARQSFLSLLQHRRAADSLILFSLSLLALSVSFTVYNVDKSHYGVSVNSGPSRIDYCDRLNAGGEQTRRFHVLPSALRLGGEESTHRGPLSSAEDEKDMRSGREEEEETEDLCASCNWASCVRTT